MKKLSLIVFAFILGHAALAQKYIPQIGIGTVINYNAEAVNMGYKSPLTLSVVSLNDPMKFNWTIPALGNGSFLIPARSLESGTKMKLKVPESNEPIVYKDDETILFISKSALSDLIKDQSFTLNKIKLSVKPSADPYLINGKEADVIQVVSDNGKTNIWILNNPSFPLIVKMTGNPSGIDLDLASIKE